MRVRTKLVLGFSAVVLLLWAIGLFAGTNLLNLKNQFATVGDTVLPGTLAMKDVENHASEAYHETMTYILSDDVKAKEAALSHLSQLQEIETGYFLYGTTEIDKFVADVEIASVIIDFYYSLAAIINYKDRGTDLDELLEKDRNTCMPALLALQQEVSGRKELYTEELAAVETSFEKTYSSGIKTLVLIAGLMTLLAILGAVILTRSIVRPLHALHKGTEMIAQGNFNYKVGTTARDEIGQLSRAFDQMTHSLSTSMTSIDRLNQEINDRKRAEEASRISEEKFSKAFHASPNTMTITTVKGGKFIEVNDSYIKITGYSLEETIGRSATELGIWAKAKDRDRMLEILKEQGRVNTEEFKFRMKSGEIRDWLFSAEPITVGSEPCLISMTIDITYRKRMERQLQQQMDELQRVNKKLQELDKMKDSFLSTVSHELRTPLTSIKSFAEILLTYDEDKDTQKEFLTIINDESDRLTKLINDFLDLSKIEAGRMQWDNIELSLVPIVQNALNVTQAIAKQKNLALIFNPTIDPPLVLGDRDRLVQVVTNLLSNSIKFTPEDGQITVGIRTRKAEKPEKESDMVVVSVTDTGIGIAPENHKDVFDKFKQVGDTLTDKPKGTGLGLPICKEIIEHHGGTIWVESELGKGCTFSFSLPVLQKSSEGAPKTDKSSPFFLPIENKADHKAPEAGKDEIIEVTKRNKTILVVDDEANIRRFLAYELKQKGYSIFEASNGEEALDLARLYHPDLITLDVQMPDINGFDVTAILKNDDDTKDIPILILSVIEDRHKAYKLGANDYVTKPFKKEEVFVKVNRLLEGTKNKILVVDDDKSLIKSVKYQLEHRGYSVNSAYDGKQALEMVGSNHPDLILLDVVMPNINGYEVIKALKSNPDTAGIRIVLMTGIDIDGGRVKALSLGANEYVNKTDGFNKLFESIENTLANRVVA